MTADTTRRSFLAGTGLGAASVLSACASAPSPLEPPADPPRTLDIHVHLFGIGDAGTQCRVSKAVQRGLVFRGLVLLLDLGGDRALDLAYRERLAADLSNAGVDRAALIGQDAIYDPRGEPDLERTPFLVPSDEVFRTAAMHPELFVPCPSINPQRRDALAELDSCHARGAPMIKVHPPIQGVDVADPRHRPFFRRCAELDILVLVHTGHEHAAPVVDIRLADPAKLEPVLLAGCRVVACHAGTGRPSDSPDFLPAFVDLVHRYDNLWGDTSVLCTSGRKRDLERLLDDDVVRSRLVHGSDYPFPPLPVQFADRIGRKRALELSTDKNIARRDLAIKRLLGMEATFSRAYDLVFGPTPGITRRNATSLSAGARNK